MYELYLSYIFIVYTLADVYTRLNLAQTDITKIRVGFTLREKHEHV